MSAREVIAECLEDEFGRHADARADAILEDLTAAGYTIIRDDENHKATAERCIAANETARTAVIYSSQVAYVSGVRKGHDRAEAALRSLIKEDGE